MATPVEGPENSGQAAGRPPVRLAAVQRTTPPTLTDGQVAELQADTRGNLATILRGIGAASTLRTVGVELVGNIGDASSNIPGSALGVYSFLAALNGATWDRLRTPSVFKPFASTAITAGVGATIWTPGAGKKFRLMGWLISTSVAGQLIFGDNAVGTVIARSEAAIAAGVSNPVDLGNGILSAAANNVLKLDGPTGNVAGMVWGTEE